MRAVRIEGDSRPVGAPPNWDESKAGRCGDLFVRVDTDSGYRFMTSAWEADSEECGWLLAGANVQLGVTAPQHPVVRMGIGPIPGDGPPVYTIRQVTHEGGQAVRVTAFVPGTKDRLPTRVWAICPLTDGLLVAVVECLSDIRARLESEEA